MEVDLVTRIWGAMTRALQRLHRAAQRAFRQVASRLSSGLGAPTRLGSPLLQPAIELVRARESGAGQPEALSGAQDGRDGDDGPGARASLPRSRLERDELLPYGDFSGADEEERFAALPPIPADAVDDVDWDALARALTRNA